MKTLAWMGLLSFCLTAEAVRLLKADIPYLDGERH